MGLGSIELNVTVSRAQDYAQIRHAEDHKGIVDQTNFGQTIKKETEDKANTVTRGDDLNNNQKKFDAKEKGSNEYHGDGGREREERKEDRQPDGKVMRKASSYSSFDIRI